MIPIVTPTEMAAIDEAAPEPVDELIERAGAALARRAVRLLGGTYGRRVVVIAGKGNNGADGRAAAVRLRGRGVRVAVIDATDAPLSLPAADLVIDAAYGTGFRGEWNPPDPGDSPVLACDIPSGVDGVTGGSRGALRATATVTFAALKPGLLLGDGAVLAGRIEVADIGLDATSARAQLVERSDAVAVVPRRSRQAHKWQSGVRIVGGSPGMSGAAYLCARAAGRAGAGMVVCSAPGVAAQDLALPTEAVGRSLPGDGWVAEVLDDIDRFAALVIGPGLGRDEATLAAARELLAAAPVPVIVDADGLMAVAGHEHVARNRLGPTVLTPHDGEFAALTGERPAADRFGAVRDVAARYGCTVLLKGATTLVADPPGEVAAVSTGDARLATAGTGDVLSGVLAAFVGTAASDGAGPTPERLRAAVAGAAWVHGAAARRGPAAGMLSTDLPDLVGAELASLAAHSPDLRPNRAESGRSGRKLREVRPRDASWDRGQ